MFIFKKKRKPIVKNEDSSTKSDSIFPTAKSTLEIATSKWEYATAEKILKEIKDESSIGKRRATFYNSLISDELVKELRSLGYRVEVHDSPLSISPYFEIYW